MKIALLEPIGVPEGTLDELSAGFRERGHTFVSYPRKAESEKELIERSEGCEVVMIANTPYPDAVVRACPELRLLSVAFTGIDHVGTEACREQGVTVCNAAGYSDETVAELAIGMAVGAMRRMVTADAAVRRGGTSAGIGGREIAGRTVGIIGLGRIGMRTAELFQAFGARVIAFSRTEKPEAKARGIEYRSLEQVLSESDILSLHLPNNAETRGMIGREQIALMRPDAVFINCARGPIVDNAALAEALNEDRLGFVCADVFDMEPPLPADYPLLHAKNTLLTPHQGFISEESMERRAGIVFGNVYAWLDGKPENVCR